MRDTEWPSGTAVIRLEKNQIGVHPEDWLLYYPQVPLSNPVRDLRLDAAERLEFSGNAGKAAQAYESLVHNSGPQVRAAAFNGLARLNRKAKNFEAGLHT